MSKLRGGVTALAATGALMLVTSGGAARVVGTSGPDVLRGTRSSDSIYGRGGNDRLYGLAGDDRLFGGPGADRIWCGKGRDVVVADARDTVARDCEVVRKPAPAPPPHHPPPPAAPPAPPPPASFVLPGHYVALTKQERYVHLEVYPDGRALTNLRVEFDADCTPPPRLSIPFDVAGDIAIDANGVFSVASASGDGRLHLTLRATFGPAGTLAGAFRVAGGSESSGTRQECDSGEVSFQGVRRDP